MEPEEQEEKELGLFIFEYLNNWKFCKFSFGFNISIESFSIWPKDSKLVDDYMVFNEAEVKNYKEYYLSINLGYWQFIIGFRRKIN